MHENTRLLLEKLKQETTHCITIQNKRFIVYKGVFSPKYFFSTAWLAKQLKTIVKTGTFLEVGCGCGAISILLANHLTVHASDISESAYQNTKENAQLHNQPISIYKGDVYEPLPHIHFDTIFWAYPFGYLPHTYKPDIYEQMVFDPGYNSLKKFLTPPKPPKQLLLVFSKTLGNNLLFKTLTKNYTVKLLAETEDYENNKLVDMGIYQLK